MAPNSGQLNLSYSDVAAESPSQDLPVPRPDEPNVYNLPKGLHPTYRALPLPVRLAMGLLSTWGAAISTFGGRLIWLRPLLSVAKQQIDARKIAALLIKTVVFFLLSNLALQETFTAPSRISTKDLIDRYFLPSKLSNYETVNLPDGQSLGVHSLQYESAGPSHQYSALYLNHGFGASSLSWLPILPKLADRLRVKRTLAHDTVGFGFTDRPKNISFYTPHTSSKIGLQVLRSKAADASSILLMGHSMGSLATLEMAAELPEDVAVTVVLVAPALGLSPGKTRDASSPNSVVEFFHSFGIGPPVCYFLKRLVGVDGFWKRGLQPVWGDPKLVSDGDALRYQWPSIGKGWEQGLLRFTRGMSSFSDSGLLRRAANRPNTRIVVVTGTRDKVISRKMVEKAFSEFPDISILEMEGCGHNPFEEKADDFIDLIERVLGDTDNGRSSSSQ